MKKRLYTVQTDMGMAIREVPRRTKNPWRHLAYQVGADNIRSYHPATKEDLDWVKAMGGYIPE